MNPLTAVNAAILAVDQPNPELGPFAPLANKISGLTWGVTGVIALIALLAAAGIYAYEKWTMKQSSILSLIMGVLMLVGVGAIAASVVNYMQGSS